MHKEESTTSNYWGGRYDQQAARRKVRLTSGRIEGATGRRYGGRYNPQLVRRKAIGESQGRRYDRGFGR